MNLFSSILIANRGEIACRIIRTARREGYRTIAVYSEPDANTLHKNLADDSVCIGPGSVSESYLRQDKILQAAKSSSAEAIHPGYGFLSENADFAEACESEGLVFIGPPAEAIRVMGNKAESKRRVATKNVLCIPGYQGADQSDEILKEEALKIGFPIMVKAAAGGGGRGMRVVDQESELFESIALARAEALASFGSDELILEKVIITPRHVEIQIFSDNHGNTIHLGERDCSIQRRHQKVIEESPSPFMTNDLREEMGAVAVTVAESIDYRGAGTVEFLLDKQNTFYFLEMNTRIQVEHPVTEAVTGLDLVALQLQVAQGESLEIPQEDVSLKGHAIEVRLYAENPAQDFLPTSGFVHKWVPPNGPGIRVDAGISSNEIVSPFYDPMIAKIVASGASREIARKRLIEALENTILFGPANNQHFLIACLSRERFISGDVTTSFIDEEFEPSELDVHRSNFEYNAVAAVIESNLDYLSAKEASVLVSPSLKDWSSSRRLISRKQYRYEEISHDLVLLSIGRDCYRVTAGENQCVVEILSISDQDGLISIDGSRKKVQFYRTQADSLYLSLDGRSQEYCDQIRLDGSDALDCGSGKIRAPMHGLLRELLVSVGDTIKIGQKLCVLEAMKMHYEITADGDGLVKNVITKVGDQVATDDLLLEIEMSE